MFVRHLRELAARGRRGALRRRGLRGRGLRGAPASRRAPRRPTCSPRAARPSPARDHRDDAGCKHVRESITIAPSSPRFACSWSRTLAPPAPVSASPMGGSVSHWAGGAKAALRRGAPVTRPCVGRVVMRCEPPSGRLRPSGRRTRRGPALVAVLDAVPAVVRRAVGRRTYGSSDRLVSPVGDPRRSCTCAGDVSLRSFANGLLRGCEHLLVRSERCSRGLATSSGSAPRGLGRLAARELAAERARCGSTRRRGRFARRTVRPESSRPMARDGAAYRTPYPIRHRLGRDHRPCRRAAWVIVWRSIVTDRATSAVRARRANSADQRVGDRAGTHGTAAEHPSRRRRMSV